MGYLYVAHNLLHSPLRGQGEAKRVVEIFMPQPEGSQVPGCVCWNFRLVVRVPWLANAGKINSTKVAEITPCGTQ